MDENMAPPAKRRKITKVLAQQVVAFQSDIAPPNPTPTLSHVVQSIETVPATIPTSTRTVQSVDKVHVEIKRALSPFHHGYAHLQVRQGTAVSSSTTAEAVVSVVASVNAFGSTTALTTVATSSDSSSVPSYSSTTTTTLVVSSGLTSSSTTGSETTYSPTSTGSEGLIGLSPTTAPTSSTVDSGSAASNSSTTESPSSTIIAGTVDGYTAQTVFNNASNNTATSTGSESSTSGHSSGSSHHSSATSTDSAFVFVATLSDGKVATITRSQHAYETTFSDGQVSTIAAASSTGSSAASQSPRASESTATETGPVVHSTVFTTTYAPGPNGIASAATVTSAVGVPAPGSPTTASTSSTTLASGGGGGNGPTAPPGTIAGGVVGGAAGLAVILLIAMLFLRWYRRRSEFGHQALPPNSAPQTSDQGSSARSGPGMAERAGLMPFVAAVPTLFRHHNRSQEVTSESAPGAERGFTRVSGRKLPSAFSEGMSAAPPPRPPPLNMPLVRAGHSDESSQPPERNLSSTSFYRDSQGFYGGDGDNRARSPNPFADPSTPMINTNVAPAELDGSGRDHPTMSPGPQRKPTIHGPGPFSPTASTVTSPIVGGPMSPGAPPYSAAAATFNRSETPPSVDGSRGSRFLEEV